MPTNIAIGTQENNHMLSVCIITKNEEHNLARCLKLYVRAFLFCGVD